MQNTDLAIGCSLRAEPHGGPPTWWVHEAVEEVSPGHCGHRGGRMQKPEDSEAKGVGRGESATSQLCGNGGREHPGNETAHVDIITPQKRHPPPPHLPWGSSAPGPHSPLPHCWCPHRAGRGGTAVDRLLRMRCTGPACPQGCPCRSSPGLPSPVCALHRSPPQPAKHSRAPSVGSTTRMTKYSFQSPNSQACQLGRKQPVWDKARGIRQLQVAGPFWQGGERAR